MTGPTSLPSRRAGLADNPLVSDARATCSLDRQLGGKSIFAIENGIRKFYYNGFDIGLVFSINIIHVFIHKLINSINDYSLYIVIVIVIFIWWSPFIPSRNLDEVFTYNHTWL